MATTERPLGTEPATVRSYLALPNFKANHRKVLVADEGERFRAVITSANPHDGSSRHSPHRRSPNRSRPSPQNQ